jgi:3-phenylpropionate/trans-cinnamate dioxygenase ferredoxin reductase subunit
VGANIDKERTMTTQKQTFVIVGASLAGAKAAETLREEGFDGRVVLIGAEPERPYERPPLSKDYLRGESEREKLYVHEQGFYSEKEIELRVEETVLSIDPAQREVTLQSGERLSFDRLLLATGAEPRRLSTPGSDLDGIHYLRSLADSDQLRERLDNASKLVVIGSGWIGSEVAASARQRGLEVSVIEPLLVPLERVLGDEVGAIYRDIHLEHGVDMRFGAGARSFEGDGRVERVVTEDGEVLDCDAVLVGIGAQPRTELALQAGLEVENGVLVDPRLQTSDPAIFAAGDIANHLHPRLGRIRVEHWANALHQGPAAARSMLGKDEPYDRVPYFFSDQYDVGMEYSGYATDWDRVVFRGDPANHEFIAFWMKDGRVKAGMNVNVWDVAETIQALVQSEQPLDERRLADPGVPLSDLLAGEDPDSGEAVQ